MTGIDWRILKLIGGTYVQKNEKLNNYLDDFMEVLRISLFPE